jgi:hypothetical protein
MPTRNMADHPLVKSEFSGQLISTWSEEWRQECEVAHLLAMPVAKRDNFLDGVPGSLDREERGIQGARGEAEAAFLRSEIERLSSIRRRDQGRA